MNRASQSRDINEDEWSCQRSGSKSRKMKGQIAQRPAPGRWHLAKMYRIKNDREATQKDSETTCLNSSRMEKKSFPENIRNFPRSLQNLSISSFCHLFGPRSNPNLNLTFADASPGSDLSCQATGPQKPWGSTLSHSFEAANPTKIYKNKSHKIASQ